MKSKKDTQASVSSTSPKSTAKDNLSSTEKSRTIKDGIFGFFKRRMSLSVAGNSAHTAPTSAGDIAKTSGVFGSKLGSKDNLADLSASLNVVSAIPADIDDEPIVGYGINSETILEWELEPFVVNWVWVVLTAIQPYVTQLAQQEDQDLLIAVIANKMHAAVKMALPKGEQEFQTDVVRRMLKERIDPFLDRAIKKKITFSAKKLVGQVVGVSEKGMRDSNEDRHVAFPYLNEIVGRENTNGNLSYFAVFDGHGGIECAHFAATHLHLNLANHKMLTTDIRRALHESFLYTNRQWENAVQRGASSACGSTAVVAVFQDKTLHVAWAGDSACMLFLKSGIWLDFVVPHKPSNEKEKARIASLGGFVQNDRVNGTLAVSRSFGDVKYGCVNPEPEIINYGLTGNEDFLLLACDGLTDVMTPIDILEIVKTASKDERGEEQISQRLVNAALDRGSTDNISVVYVSLKKITEADLKTLPSYTPTQALDTNATTSVFSRIASKNSGGSNSRLTSSSTKATAESQLTLKRTEKSKEELEREREEEERQRREDEELANADTPPVPVSELEPVADNQENQIVVSELTVIELEPDSSEPVVDASVLTDAADISDRPGEPQNPPSPRFDPVSDQSEPVSYTDVPESSIISLGGIYPQPMTSSGAPSLSRPSRPTAPRPISTNGVATNKVREWNDPNIYALSELSALAAILSSSKSDDSK